MSSFFIKSGTPLTKILFQESASKSNHISSKMFLFSSRIFISLGVRFRLSQMRSP